MNSILKKTLGAGVMLLSIYFTYDLPGAINHNLEFDKDNSETKINILYSAYSIPNIILPYFFSHTTYLSKYAMTLLLASFVLSGQVIFSLGAYVRSFILMVIGRIVFGIGSESYSVVQNKIMTEQFKAGDLAEAMVFYNTCGRIGTILTFLFIPLISKSFGVFPANILSCVLISVGFHSCYITYLKIKKSTQESLEYPSISIEINEAPQNEETNQENSSKSHSFWLLLVFCFLFGMVWSPFYNIAPMMYQKRFSLSSNISSFTVSIVESISMMMSFFIRPILKGKGHKLNLIIIGMFILMVAHLSILTDAFSAYLSVILLGISAPFISFYWPCIPKIVAKEKLSSAFGIIYCVMNLAFTVSPLLVALLTIKSPTYFLVEVYLILLSITGVIVLLILSYKNSCYKLKLNEIDD